MRLLITLAMLAGCSNTKDSGSYYDTGSGEYDGLNSESNTGRDLETTWVTINEGYCTVTEMPYGSSDEYAVIHPISNGPGSTDDQFYESGVGGLLEINCEAYVTPQYDPQITVDTSGCVRVYCDGVSDSASCSNPDDLYVYVYAPGAYGGGDHADDCSLNSTIGRG